MKKLLMVLAIGVFAACNEAPSSTDADAATENVQEAVDAVTDSATDAIDSVAQAATDSINAKVDSLQQ